MNYELMQVVDLTLCARKALRENEEIPFVSDAFVRSVKFVFLPKGIFGKRVCANSAAEWLSLCKKRGLRDIFLQFPVAEERHLLGFSNTSGGVIACVWKNGTVSYFSPWWASDNGWHVTYTEYRGYALQKTVYEDRTEEFKQVLLEIEAFASQLEHPGFSSIFHRAYVALCDFSQIEKYPVPSQIEEDPVPSFVPEDRKGLYFALQTADVFGAMGSWNDSPSWQAENLGRMEEYNALSDRLHHQLRYHMMFLANERV